MSKPDVEPVVMPNECAFCRRPATQIVRTRAGNSFDLCDTCSDHVKFDEEEQVNLEIHDERGCSE